jgi:hypothetical protein
MFDQWSPKQSRNALIVFGQEEVLAQFLKFLLAQPAISITIDHVERYGRILFGDSQTLVEICKIGQRYESIMVGVDGLEKEGQKAAGLFFHVLVVEHFLHFDQVLLDGHQVVG